MEEIMGLGLSGTAFLTGVGH